MILALAGLQGFGGSCQGGNLEVRVAEGAVHEIVLHLGIWGWVATLILQVCILILQELG